MSAVVTHTLLPSFQYQPGVNRHRLHFCPLFHILASLKQQEEEQKVWLQGSRFNVLAWVWQEYFILFFSEVPLRLFEHFLHLWISLMWLFLNTLWSCCLNVVYLTECSPLSHKSRFAPSLPWHMLPNPADFLLCSRSLPGFMSGKGCLPCGVQQS